MKAVFFATPAEYRSWLEDHHDNTAELWVGFYKITSGRPSITWPEAVDEALCFGWIDGQRRGIDRLSYTIRFTPRKPGGIWSSVNIKRVKELTARGVMSPAGHQAFEARNPGRSGIYSYEQRKAAELDPAAERQFRASKKAWGFFQKQPPSYRKAAIWWVVSAKRAETRVKRLSELIRDSEQSRTVRPLTRRTGPG
jgi:uncharacterized protein YdeI (YjbR/CyaY-like superfamily)